MTIQQFTKMHGLGNDFVIIDGRDGSWIHDDTVVRALSDRHTGIGCDQFIVMEPPTDANADVFMRIYNPDGGEAGACGNATRCVASLLMPETSQTEIVIQTISGLLDCENLGHGQYRVDMGIARTDWRDIPLAMAIDTQAIELGADLNINLSIQPPNASGALKSLGPGTCVNMGNPHIVFMVPDIDAIHLSDIGPFIETLDLFPERINVEIVQILSPDRIRLRVWERGAGITLACGSGACASLVAMARRGLTGRKADVVLDGGTLTIEWLPDNHVLMTGPVATSFTGTIDTNLGGKMP